MKKARSAALRIAALLFFVTACEQVSNVNPTTHDSQNDEIGADIRVVTLAPNLAELVYAAQAGDKLVGISAYTDYPPAAAELPIISDAFLVDQEQLALVRPDLLLAWENGTPAHVIDQLRQAGFRVEARESLGGEPLLLAPEALGDLVEEAITERREIFATFAQRGKLELDDLEAIVEILAEAALLDLLLEIAVGRGDDPHIDLDAARAPDPLELPLLQDPQHLGLGLGRHVADLIEEDRAAFRGLESAHTLLIRARKGALLVAEELALDQLAVDRRTVDGHEGTIAPARQGVEPPRHQLLSGAALSTNEHGNVRVGDLLDDLPNFLHLRIVA